MNSARPSRGSFHLIGPTADATEPREKASTQDSRWTKPLATLSLLWVATSAGAGIAFLTQIQLARALGPAAYGLFASSLATVSMVAPLAGFGLSQFLLKAYGQEGWQADRWMQAASRFIAATCTLTIVILLGWAWFVAPNTATRLMLLALVPVALGVLSVDLIGTKLRLEERYGPLALWQLAIPVSRLLVVLLIALLPGASGHQAALGYSTAALTVTALAIGPLYSMMKGGIRLHGHGPRPFHPKESTRNPDARMLWSQAWAYGLSAALYPIFFQVGTVLLKYLDSDVQAGTYGIAMAVMTAIYLLPATIYQKYLLSKLHRWAAHDREKLWAVYRKGNLAMLALGIVVGVLLAALSPSVIPVAFGERYRAVSGVLLILAFCTPIRFLSSSVGSALLTERHMKYRVAAMGVATVATVASNILLIPTRGASGAAFATVIGELVLLGMMALGVGHFRRIEEPVVDHPSK